MGQLCFKAPGRLERTALRVLCAGSANKSAYLAIGVLNAPLLCLFLLISERAAEVMCLLKLFSWKFYRFCAFSCRITTSALDSG